MNAKDDYKGIVLGIIIITKNNTLVNRRIAKLMTVTVTVILVMLRKYDNNNSNFYFEKSDINIKRRVIVRINKI